MGRGEEGRGESKGKKRGMSGNSRGMRGDWLGCDGEERREVKDGLKRKERRTAVRGEWDGERGLEYGVRRSAAC